MSMSTQVGERQRVAILLAILLVATCLRLAWLGRLSLWYDEVVSMRLAREASPAGLLRQLFQIDATRAPLHPLLLQAWLRLFGTSDFSGRAFSAACGIATVALVYRIGRQLYDGPTAFWGAWLAAISPLLVRYSQEARMYAWLVFLTCLSWDLLLSMRRASSPWRAAAFAITQIGLVYSHPLGIGLIAAQGLAYLVARADFRLGLRGWLASQAALILAIAPWVRFYLDHPPESLVGRPTIRSLIGLPIGFTGGDSRTLAACLAIIAWGLIAFRRRDDEVGHPARKGRLLVDQPTPPAMLLIWFAVPPLLLFAYSMFAHPIFGPARYTLYVGPAYLLLVARGLVKLPRPLRYGAALIGVAQAALMLNTSVYAPDLKADWRAASQAIRRFDPPPQVVVLTEDPAQNVEVEVARYYLGPTVEVIPIGEALIHPPPGTPYRSGKSFIVFVVGERGGLPVATIPESLDRTYEHIIIQSFPGLRLLWKYRARTMDGPG